MDGIGDAIGTGGDEDALEARQDSRLHPVGMALRRTYDADNHNSLSAEVTALMLALARVPFEPHECVTRIAVPSPSPSPMPRAGLLSRMRRALHRTRDA